MLENQYKCPKCGEPMVLRHGNKVDFYGCSNYGTYGCTGKRDLKGRSWGNDFPGDVDAPSSNLYDSLIQDGWSHEEAKECSDEWERQNENDHFGHCFN